MPEAIAFIVLVLVAGWVLSLIALAIWTLLYHIGLAIIILVIGN